MTDIEREWSEYVQTTAFLSPHTIKSYKNSHNKITEYLEKPISETSVLEIINAVRDLTENPSSQSTLYTAVIVFRKLKNLDNDLIWKEKKALIPAEKVARQITSASKKQYLPTMDILKKHMNSHFYNQDWRGYIICFLLINYNTRNADLDLEFVENLHKTKADKTKNYIVIRKNDFIYIRNSFKTARKYKAKRHTFKSVPFGRAVRYYIAEHPPNTRVYLLNKEGLPVNNNSIANYIKKHTYQGLTEGDYNKCAVSSITEIADYGQLVALGERRGTDVKTLIEYYNIPYNEKLWGGSI